MSLDLAAGLNLMFRLCPCSMYMFKREMLHYTRITVKEYCTKN